MTILVSDNDKIDFGAPLRMDDRTFERFVVFLRTRFHTVQVEESTAMRGHGQRLGDRRLGAAWTSDELQLLVDPTLDQQEVCSLLGRSPMSIQMKTGSFLDGFMAWAKSQDTPITAETAVYLIERYLRTLDAEKADRRRMRKLANPKFLEKEIGRLKSREATLRLQVSVKRLATAADDLEECVRERQELEAALTAIVAEQEATEQAAVNDKAGNDA